MPVLRDRNRQRLQGVYPYTVLKLATSLGHSRVELRKE